MSWDFAFSLPLKPSPWFPVSSYSCLLTRWLCLQAAPARWWGGPRPAWYSPACWWSSPATESPAQPLESAARGDTGTFQQIRNSTSGEVAHVMEATSRSVNTMRANPCDRLFCTITTEVLDTLKSLLWPRLCSVV